MTNMDKLYQAVESRGPVCVGLDTDFSYLPADFVKPELTAGENIVRFNRAILEATKEVAGGGPRVLLAARACRRQQREQHASKLFHGGSSFLLFGAGLAAPYIVNAFGALTSFLHRTMQALPDTVRHHQHRIA